LHKSNRLKIVLRTAGAETRFLKLLRYIVGCPIEASAPRIAALQIVAREKLNMAPPAAPGNFPVRARQQKRSTGKHGCNSFHQ